MIMLQPRQRSAIKGLVFGVRKDDCSCDPCDCDPCECGDSLISNYPRWRVSGYYIKSGIFHEQQLAEQILLGLAQPEREGSLEGWQEVLLIGKDASLEQIHALLALFESDLRSMPAEIGAYPRVTRAIYRAEIAYQMTDKGPGLCALFSPERANLVRVDAGRRDVRAWSYEGRVKMRGNIHIASI